MSTRPKYKRRVRGSANQRGRVFRVDRGEHAASLQRIQAAASGNTQHIADVAEGHIPPATVDEARLALQYLEGKKQAEEQKRLETKKALLELEKGTGTIHAVRRALSREQLKRGLRETEVDISRAARRRIGGAVRSFLRGSGQSRSPAQVIMPSGETTPVPVVTTSRPSVAVSTTVDGREVDATVKRHIAQSVGLPKYVQGVSSDFERVVANVPGVSRIERDASDPYHYRVYVGGLNGYVDYRAKRYDVSGILRWSRNGEQ